MEMLWVSSRSSLSTEAPKGSKRAHLGPKGVSQDMASKGLNRVSTHLSRGLKGEELAGHSLLQRWIHL